MRRNPKHQSPQAKRLNLMIVSIATTHSTQTTDTISTPSQRKGVWLLHDRGTHRFAETLSSCCFPGAVGSFCCFYRVIDWPTSNPHNLPFYGLYLLIEGYLLLNCRLLGLQVCLAYALASCFRMVHVNSLWSFVAQLQFRG